MSINDELALNKNASKVQTSPKAQNAMRAAASAMYAKQVTTGEGELVTRESTDPKLARLAHDLESVYSHPLCKQFLTERPNIYLVESPAGELGIKELKNMPFAGAISENTILINKQIAALLNPKELKAVISHEIGHILQGDIDARNGLKSDKQSNQRMERGADRLGAMLSGEPESLKSALMKMDQAMLDAFKGKDDLLSKTLKYVTERTVKYGGRSHPHTYSRSHTIDKVAEAMRDPTEKSHLESEMARRLAEDVKYR